ncbi:hypothetical protein EI94DRAFT_1832535 [Lactarius quietus]|nr:hypothetical protein EI94DRAFT_1762138 [Lactarius quietus]KAF8262918.1 hypothetical protein EI94DRAFT_1832535 [Lactarius quietus]
MPPNTICNRSSSHTLPSDDENTPTLNLNTSKEVLIKIARQHQAGKNALSQENEALRRKLADISNDNYDENNEGHSGGSAHQSKRQRTHNPTPTGSDDEIEADTNAQAEDEFVNSIGHKFCIICAPWVRKGTDIFKIKFDNTYDVTERFENDNNKVRGQLEEIVGLLKEQLNQDTILCQKWVRREFMKGLNTQRANTATRIRHNCSAVFGVLDTNLVNAEHRRAKFRGRIGWVPNGSGGGTYSSVDVEIIHKDYSGKYELSKIFLNPVLMGIFVALIRGPTSARNFMLGNTTYYPQTETIARIHSICNITPGAIATCAILARWALSGDASLQEIGSGTGI